MTTPAPILQITDGTTSIDLLDGRGFLLLDWIPSLAEPKGGGQWADSLLVEGRKLAYVQMSNIVDTFELKVKGVDQDDAIHKLQELRRLLEKARQYWTSDAQNEPVWLKARAAYETNARYAVIMDYRTPRDANPFRQPFFACDPLVDGFLLTVEHSAWQENEPGDATCVEVSAEQVFYGGLIQDDFEPAANTDDAYVLEIGSSIYLYNSQLIFGKGNGFFSHAGIRFSNVTIPNGATIVGAYIEMTCAFTSDGVPCNARIYGEDEDDPAPFSTYADFMGRTRTSHSVNWNNIPNWTEGNTYQSPDITSIIQEIVDRVGWASGQHMTIFIQDNGSPAIPDLYNRREFASYENGTYAIPKLVIQYSSGTPHTFGQEAVCDPGSVYITNKHNRANLTHIYRYDADDGGAPSWTSLLGTATPYALFPAVPAAGDIVYFGAAVTVSDSGPFNNLVFDISTAQVDLTTIVWEYYNGTTWATLTVRDNTATSDPFDRTGVHSAHWVQPADWVTVAVNGVTGYWVRARVTAVGAAPAPPEQDNRDVYSAVWPFVEIQADQVAGDIPALARIRLTNQSDAASGSPVLHTNRLIVGLRSLSRGENFTPFLNISDEQNPTGVTVTLGANTTYSNDPITITGRRASFAFSGANTSTEVTITLNNTIAPEYMGRFRAFLRYKHHAGNPGGSYFRLITTPGGGGLARYSEYYFPQVNTDFQIADFGIIEIQPRAPGDNYGAIKFEIEVVTTTVDQEIYFYDLILMPVDEWATDAVDESGLAARTGAVGNGDLLDIDSVTYPRAVDQAILRQVSDGRIIGYFQNRQPGPVLLQANRDQRLWFLALMYETGTELSAPIAISHSVQVYRVQRYLSARGRR